MRQRLKPRQHVRKMRSGKRVLVNKGVKRRSRVYRGVDDMELTLLGLKGKLEPHGKYGGVFVTPSKSIAEKYNRNVLEIETDGLNIEKVPGRSRMLISKGDIWPGNIVKVHRSKRVKRRSKTERQKVNNYDHAKANNLIEAYRKDNLALAQKVWNSKADLDVQPIKEKVAYNNIRIDALNKKYFKENPR